MADITMCTGTECCLKENCKRFNTTNVDLMQTYFFDDVPIKKNKCEYFWEK